MSDDGVAALLPGLSTKSSLCLRLDATRITKASVLAIAARFPKLFSLDVDAVDCDVGDEDVLTVAKCCPDLRHLSYRNQGQMSQATRDALKASNPNLSICGLAVIFSPTAAAVNTTLRVNLYYTGLTHSATITREGHSASRAAMQLGRDFTVALPIVMGPRSVTWFTVGK